MHCRKQLMPEQKLEQKYEIHWKRRNSSPEKISGFERIKCLKMSFNKWHQNEYLKKSSSMKIATKATNSENEKKHENL